MTMSLRVRQRNQRWLKILGYNTEDIVKWRKLGLLSLALTFVTVEIHLNLQGNTLLEEITGKEILFRKNEIFYLNKFINI